MFKTLKADRLDPIEMEHPKFGQFAQQAGWVRAAEVESCLAEQRVRGGLLGDRLVGCGLLNSDQVTEILGCQAAWVAQSWQAELAPLRFPYPASLSLCLPAYNEQDNIVATLRAREPFCRISSKSLRLSWSTTVRPTRRRRAAAGGAARRPRPIGAA